MTITDVPAPQRAKIPNPAELAASLAARGKATSAPTVPAGQERLPEGLPEVTWMLVTPAMAQQWLNDHNVIQRDGDGNVVKKNRNLDRKHTAMFARTMASNSWSPTVEPIKFSWPQTDKGGYIELLDGQHRLAGVIQAGESDPSIQVLLPIATNVDPAAQRDMDSGRKRTVGDKLSMTGAATYTNNVAGMARFIWNLQTGTSIRPNPPSDTELLKIIEADPDIIWVSDHVAPHLPKGVGLTQTLAGYCYYRFHKVDPTAARDFFASLHELTGLPPKSPIAALNRALNSKRKGAHKDRVAAVAMVFSAWNAWRNEEERERVFARQHKDGHYELPELV